MQHGEVVVGLGQLGIVLGELRERDDGVGHAAGFGLDHALEETHLRVSRLRREVLVSTLQGLRVLARTQQLVDVVVLVRERRAAAGEGGSQRKQAQSLGKCLVRTRHRTSGFSCSLAGGKPAIGAIYCGGL